MIAATVMVVVSIASWIGAYQSSVTVDRGRPYVWRSGAAVFLANSQLHQVTCTIDHDDWEGVVRLPAAGGLAVRGARIARQSDAPVTVTCDGRVVVSSGPVLLFYRLASWSETLPLSLTVLLLIAWFRWRERNGIDAAERLWRQARYLTRRRRFR
jgi:hypothetical protein